MLVMIGDSLTYYGRPHLSELHPGWHIDGVGGRPVRDLGPRIDYWLEEVGNMQDLVVALGTNDTPGWTKQDYVDAVGKVPNWTRVHFVTTFSDAERWGQNAYDNQKENSAWMKEIAAERERTFTIGWRWYAENKPTVRNENTGEQVPLLRDGKHASSPWGERFWADLVSDRVGENQEEARSS